MTGIKHHLCLSLLTLSAFLGCGEENTALVTGVVTLNGQPVYPARVNFAPKAAEGAIEAAGRLSTAMTEPDGSYRIEAAALGENSVGVMMLPADEDSEEAEDNEQPLPAGKLDKTVFTVESGENNIDLKMTAFKPQQKRGGRSRGRSRYDDD